jgi:predicted phage tail protein
MGAAAPIIGAIAGSFAGGYVASTVLAGTMIGASGFIVGMAVGRAVGSMVGSSLATSLFGEKPKLPDYSTALGDRGILQNIVGSSEPIPVVYGVRRVGGIRVFIESSGTDNEYLHLVLVLSEGEVDGVTALYLNEEASTLSKFSGLVEWTLHTGADDQLVDTNLDNRLASWTSNHRLRGTAYVYVRLKYDQDAFAGGIPQITADVRGVEVYDPRSASTAWSDNPALCVRDYLTNGRYGRAIPTSMIDEASFIAAANYCDELVYKGGTSAKRYTLNGVVDTSSTSLEVIREMLTACRGMLVFTGGKYRLVIDKPEAAGFAFTEDNVLGAWTISLGDKTNTYNRIRANFFNPERSWQPDIATIDSAGLRSLDNGLLLEREISLPFTSDEATAKQIATINLNQSRQQILTEFTATVAGIRCEVGDVITITHSTPGWSAKKFRVLRMALQNNDEVRVTALEYDETVYDFGSIPVSDATPNTNLPDPSTVAAPGAPSVIESLYITKSGAGVKAKVDLAWAAARDIFVRDYQVQYRLQSEASFRVAGVTTDTRFEIFDITPGRYDFRVKAINSVGTSSSWSTTEQEIFGLAAKPTAPSNVALQAVSSLAVLTWDQSPDLDVRIGGRIEVRHSSALSGATWANSVSLGKALAGTATVAILPLLEGTYLIRALDSSGIMSDSSSVSTDAVFRHARRHRGGRFDLAFAGQRRHRQLGRCRQPHQLRRGAGWCRHRRQLHLRRRHRCRQRQAHAPAPASELAVGAAAQHHRRAQHLDRYLGRFRWCRWRDRRLQGLRPPHR